MERNEWRSGDRGLVSAEYLIRREKQQSRVNDIAQDGVVGRAKAEQGGKYYEQICARIPTTFFFESRS